MSKPKEPPKHRVKIKFGDVEVEVEGKNAKNDAEEIFEKVEAAYKEHWKPREGALRDYR